MSTITAQMLVGKAHPNHGGIHPTHSLFLSENSRPVWTLMNTNIYKVGRVKTQQYIWIPTVENMLEDALVMVGVHVIQDPRMVQMAGEFGLLGKDSVEMYQDLDTENRKKLYEASRQIHTRNKIALTVFETSTIASQLPVLEQYFMDVEVCISQFRRECSSWTKKLMS